MYSIFLNLSKTLIQLFMTFNNLSFTNMLFFVRLSQIYMKIIFVTVNLSLLSFVDVIFSRLFDSKNTFKYFFIPKCLLRLVKTI